METSTEWLFEKLWETPKDKLTWYAILQQAKAMERQQIIKAYEYTAAGTSHYGEQYYNKTFKNK
jgi:hypothetical protein